MSRKPTGSAEIGRRIQSARVARGMSQAELAEKAGLSSSQISQIENGKSDPRVRTLIHIIEALQVSADAILRSNVPSVARIGMGEWDELLSDCSPREIELILAFSRQLKEALRQYKAGD